MGFKMKGFPYSGKSPLKVVVPPSMIEAMDRARELGVPTPEANTTKIGPASTTPKAKKSGTKTKKSGPDWSKAPKMNTQARRDWYTKNKLAQDKTTKVAAEPVKVAPKKATIKPKLETKLKTAKEPVSKKETGDERRVAASELTRGKASRKYRKAERAEQEARDAGHTGNLRKAKRKAAKATRKRRKADRSRTDTERIIMDDF